mgnify:CR=1 FL=1
MKSNQNAIASGESTGREELPGHDVCSGMPHWWDFTEYALLQMGQDQKAKQVRDEAATAPKTNLDNLRNYIPASLLSPLVTPWSAAPGRRLRLLEPRAVATPQAEAITHFARAMGAARTGDVAAAQQDIDKLKELRATLEKANQSYWAEQVEVQILAAQAWIAQGQGNQGRGAEVHARRSPTSKTAARKHISMENRLYPMRELLADMLLGYGQGAAALKEYEASMQAAPNRLRGFYSAAKAAEAAGDKKKAATYMRSLAQLTRNADGDRPEIREAKQLLASR